MNARIPLRLASCACAALLPACATVGPDYHVPAEAAVHAPAANAAFAAQGAALSAAAVPADWWRLYDDARLDALVDAALAANTDLRIANATLERSAALLAEARALRQPGVALDTGVERSQVAGEQYLLRIKPPRSDVYAAQATVGYDLDLFGGIRRGIEQASDAHEATLAARDLVRVNVAAETARAYADACAAGRQRALADRALELQQASLLLVARLREGGRATELDVARASQAVELQASVLPAFASAQRNALLRLATLSGLAPAQLDPTLADCATPPRIRQPLPVGDGASLLQRRPDVRRAERQLAAATAGIGVATAELYPDIRLGASVGTLGAISDFLTAPTRLWNFGAFVHWQANRSGARARVDAAEAATRAALANFDGVVLESLREAETALGTYLDDLQREQLLRAARDEAARVEADALRLQAGGRTNALAVLDARRVLLTAEQQLAAIEAVVAGDQVAAFLALGGGWQDTAAGAAEARP